MPTQAKPPGAGGAEGSQDLNSSNVNKHSPPSVGALLGRFVGRFRWRDSAPAPDPFI